MKKILRFLFLLLLGRNGAQASSHIWNGKADTKWYKESQNEFTITTPEQLAGLAKLVNKGNRFAYKTIKLGANIMLNDTADWQNWAKKAPKNKWKPIGFEKYTDGGHIGPIKLQSLDINPFWGTFDGNGFSVSGAYVKNRNGHQGLFGFFRGKIKNFGIVASYIEGYGNVGALVGTNDDGTISNSYSMALVVGNNYSGGLVGFNSDDGKISSCYSASTVMGKNEVIGGLAGLNNGVISNSYSTGSVTGKKYIGGLTGITNGTIHNSYSIGSVSGDSLVGGLAGLYGNLKNSKILSSYYDKETSGQSDRGKGEWKTTAKMKEEATFAGWDFGKIWRIDSIINNGYPYLKTE